MPFCFACGLQADDSVSKCTKCGTIIITKQKFDQYTEWQKQNGNDIQKSQEINPNTTSTQSSSQINNVGRKQISHETSSVKSTQNMNAQRMRAVTVPQNNNNGITKTADTTGFKSQTPADTTTNIERKSPPLNTVTAFNSFTPPKTPGKQCPGWKDGFMFDRCANCSQSKISHTESKPLVPSKSFITPSTSTAPSVSTPLPSIAPSKSFVTPSASIVSPLSTVPSKSFVTPSTVPSTVPSVSTPPPSTATSKSFILPSASTTPKPSPVGFKMSVPATKQTTPPASVPSKTSQAPAFSKLPPSKATEPPTTPTPKPAPAKPAPAISPVAAKPSTQPTNFQRPPGPSEAEISSPPEAKIKTRQSDAGYSKPLPSVPCSKCKQFLPPNEEVVKFQNKMFHQRCFTCATCGCTFSKSNVYYERKGVPYCEKDYFANQADGGVCQTCKKPIGEGQFIEVHGFPFHETCFHCNGCNKSFPGKFCLWVGQKPFCDPCGRSAFVDYYRQKNQPGAPQDLRWQYLGETQ